MKKGTMKEFYRIMYSLKVGFMFQNLMPKDFAARSKHTSFELKIVKLRQDLNETLEINAKMDNLNDTILKEKKTEI